MYQPQCEEEANAMQAEMDADAQGQYEHEQQCQWEAEAQAAAEQAQFEAEAAQEPLNAKQLIESLEKYGFKSEGWPLENCVEFQILKEMLTPKEMTPQYVESNIAQILDSLCNTCLTLDAADVEDKDAIHGFDVMYTPEDAMNALHIFSHITGNIRIHTFLVSDRTPEEKELFTQNTQRFWEVLWELFLGMTGIDPKKYYNDK